MKKVVCIKKSLIKYFEKRVRYYFFDVFKLYDFELKIESQDKEETRASTYWHDIDDGAGMILICYSIGWINTEKPDFDELDKCAFHEVCEALFSEVNELIVRRFISRKDVPNAIHRIIRRLENTVFDKYRDKK